MKIAFKHTTISAGAIATSLLIAGCNTTQPVHDQVSENYAWAKTLTENVETIPEVNMSGPAPLATPTVESYTNAAWPWGSPQNLTNPVSQQASNPAAIRPTPSPAGTAAKGSNNSGQGQVVVHVNQQVNEESMDPVADSSEPSRLEGLYSGQFDREASRVLQQFGYDFFDQNSDNLHTTGPVPGSYILGPGDEVLISISGGIEAYHRINVDRDGLLSVPESGTVSVAGQRYDDLYDHLFGFFGNLRRGFDLTVSLGRLRSISVSVIGQVKAPGTVSISALATPVAALAAAGGPEKDGSLRNLTLKRIVDGEITSKTIDLYGYLRGSQDFSTSELLRDGDILQIPVIEKTVGIAGYVQQPGIYELTSKTITVKEALELAGGLTPFSFTPLAHLETTVDGRGRQKIDVQLNEEGFLTNMQNGELLMVEAVDDARQPVVRIEGEVARPGDFQHRPSMTLSELITSADGLTINAYLPQALISRQLGPSTSIETITERTSHQQTRRVLVVDLGKALENDPTHDIVLMPLDLVTIRSFQAAQERPEVEIIGPVQRPGKYELTAGMRVSDLIAIARNPTPDVYYDQAELIRRVFDPSTRRLDVERFRFNLREALSPYNAYSDISNPVLANGDRLIIRSLQQAQVRVRIEGQVQFPGEYIFPAGKKITDLISAAGGLLDPADLRAAVFTRNSTRNLQREKMDHLNERTRRLYESAFERMVQTGSSAEGVAAKIALEQTENTLERMKSVEADGRIVIPFNTQQFPESDFNLILENGDTLNIPKKHSTISVAGHVFRPISLVAGQPISVEQALQQAGGLTETADGDLIYVIRADGTVDSVAQKPARIHNATTLLAGDVLLVPRKPMERTMGAQLSDMLFLARQAAETALVTSRIGTDVDMTLVSSPFRNQDGVNADVLLGELK